MPHLTHRVVFLLGTTSDGDVTQLVRAEAERDGDIVQGDFLDTYHNLTLKAVMGFRWLAEFCPRVSFVVKVDDDVLLHVYQVVTRLMPMLNKPHTIGCFVNYKNKSKILRDKTEKWRVNDSDFSGLEYYPFDYCSGYFVLMTGDLIQPMVDAARVVPFFWIDDVYVYGLLPHLIGDVRFLHLFGLSVSYEDAQPCFTQFGKKCVYTVVNNKNSSVDMTLMRQLWTRMNVEVPQSDIDRRRPAVANWRRRIRIGQ